MTITQTRKSIETIEAIEKMIRSARKVAEDNRDSPAYRLCVNDIADILAGRI
jgi:hypothetical protein